MPHPTPYDGLAPEKFWRSGAAESHPLTVQGLYAPKFAISQTAKIATAGSCFAQHIARYLARRHFTVMDVERAPSVMKESSKAAFGYGLYSARYGNIYACRQLLQLFKEARRGEPGAEGVWEKAGRYYDAMRPGVEPNGLDSVDDVLVHRAQHLRRVRKLFREMDIFVFTFGLTEAWVSKRTGRVFPTCPGTIAGEFNPAEFEFKNFSYREIYDDFAEFRGLVKKINPDAKFLLTVSPVPLTATASSDHVIVATTYSKSTLRAVAGDLCSTFDDIDYFPSYEIVASPWSKGFFFDGNLRTVNSGGVEAVMRVFFNAHQPSVETPKDRRPVRAPRTKEEAVCEEALLEAFGKHA